MAAYTQRLLEPLQGQLRDQAEEIGRLRERTAHLQAELHQARQRAAEQEKAAAETSRLRAELTYAERRAAELAEAAAATAEPAPTRPWWRFW